MTTALRLSRLLMLLSKAADSRVTNEVQVLGPEPTTLLNLCAQNTDVEALLFSRDLEAQLAHTHSHLNSTLGSMSDWYARIYKVR